MTTLFLVRHGETEWNRIGRWQGHADIPLTDEGREQARLLADRFVAEGQRFDQIYASDLGRAFETAQIIAAALHMSVHPLFELREIDLGGWSGLTSSEIKVRFANDWDAFERGVDFKRGGTGESLADIRERMAAVIERLVMEHPDQTLLIVSHGGTIRSAMHYVQQHTGDMTDIFITNTSITEIAVENGQYTIVRANDRAHLAEEQVIVERRAV